MSVKTYLRDQYRLLGLSSNDLFTASEIEQLNKIGEISCLLDTEGLSDSERKKLTDQKHAETKRLEELFAEYPANTPRYVNASRVCKKCDGEVLPYIDIDYVKDQYFITEFCNEWSRCNDIAVNDFCFIKFNLTWNAQHKELLHQAFVNGVEMDIKTANGIEHLHFDYFTASAGQMRTDRASFVEHNANEEHWKQLFAGLTPQMINDHGGINLNKLSAYLGLVTGASERWILESGDPIDIDRVLVVPDIETTIHCAMDHINENYDVERVGEDHEEKVNQCDGVGWFLPKLREKSTQKSKNKMIRGPWLKGLVTEFDYIKFCKVHNLEPVVVDDWGEEHNLETERIEIVLTDSQLKLAKFYDSWEQYKDMFHENNCYISATNYEEDTINPSDFNYQFLQTLLSITDEEIDSIIEKDYIEIRDLGLTVQSQLKAHGCYNPKGINDFQRSLLKYPELLRDGYSREELKKIKAAKLNNAKSGKLHFKNRRLFVVPDPFYAWGYIMNRLNPDFEPKPLLHFGEVWTAEPNYSRVDKIDLLRSPHLYIEHCIRKIVHDRPELSEWLNTSAVYTSFEDIASRILQFKQN